LREYTNWDPVSGVIEADNVPSASRRPCGLRKTSAHCHTAVCVTWSTAMPYSMGDTAHEGGVTDRDSAGRKNLAATR
jgi:hypothetical protein